MYKLLAFLILVSFCCTSCRDMFKPQSMRTGDSTNIKNASGFTGDWYWESGDTTKSFKINLIQLKDSVYGHIIGSAQVRVKYKGEVWVVSGDYKTEDDLVSVPFEPVKCNTFITESTFGLPIYQWQKQSNIMEDIHLWVQANQAAGRNSILTAYSLGKAQRLIHNLTPYGYQFYVHGAIYAMQEAIVRFKKMPAVDYLGADVSKEEMKKRIIIIPPSADSAAYLKRMQPFSLGVCSGWMQVRGAQRRRNADAGFALSDHADWQGLLQAIKATGAECVYATHGFTAPLARYLREEMGIKADVVKTSFGEDGE